QPDNRRLKVKVAQAAVVVVLVVDFQTCTFRAMDGPFSSANATASIRYLCHQPQRQEQVQQQQQRRRQRPLRVKQPDAGSISTFVCASIVLPSGPRCSTMAGER